MRTSHDFIDWCQHYASETSPGKWLAVDHNHIPVDEDENSNTLIERIQNLPLARQRQLRVIYVFPRNFV